MFVAICNMTSSSDDFFLGALLIEAAVNIGFDDEEGP